MTSPLVVRYRAPDVPCVPGALEGPLDALRTCARTAGTPELTALAASPGIDTGAEALHRVLLAALKLPTGRRHRSDLRDALSLLRPHSALYTARTCRCLRAAAKEFALAVAVALGSLGASSCDVWTVTTSDDRRWAHNGNLTTAVLLRAYPDLVEHTLLTKHRKALVEVRIEGPDTVRVTTGRNHQTTYLRLPADREPFASAMFSYAVAHHPCSVTRWPPELVQIAEHLRSTHRNLTSAATLAGDLFEAGFTDLDHQGQVAALALVTSGLDVTDPHQLIANAAAISSPVAGG